MVGLTYFSTGHGAEDSFKGVLIQPKDVNYASKSKANFLARSYQEVPVPFLSGDEGWIAQDPQLAHGARGR